MQLQEILYSQGFGTRRVCAGLVQQGYVTVQGRAQDDAFADFEAVDGLAFTVQHHVGLGLVDPRRALHGECQAVGGLELGKGVVLCPALDRHVALLDQPGAYAPGAEALRIQNLLKLHQSIAQRQPRVAALGY